MKIGFIPMTYDAHQNEAVNITTFLLAKTLAKKGHNVRIITRRKKVDKSGNKQKKYEVTGGVTIHRPYAVWFQKYMKVHYQITLLAMAATHVRRKYRFTPDIIQTVSAAPILGLRSRLLKLFFPKTKIIHQLKTQSKFRFGGYRFSRMLNGIDGVIAPNEIIRQQLIKNGCTTPITVMRSLIDTNRYAYKKISSEQRKKTLEEYGLPHNKKIILYYGHAKEVKGVTYLVEAAKHIDGSKNHIVFAWSGSGNQSPYEALADELGVTEKISFLFRPKDIARLVGVADIGVFPYATMQSTEAPPSCILECMASGLPVVASDFSELRELFVADKDIVYAEPKKPRSVAKEVTRLLDDKKLRDTLSKNGKNISKQYSASTVAEMYEQYYTTLLKGKK